MIYPNTKTNKIQLEVAKNIFFFKLSNKKNHFKWALYKRHQAGKQQIVQIIKIDMSQEIHQMKQEQKLVDRQKKIQQTKQKQKNQMKISKSYLRQSRQKYKQSNKLRQTNVFKNQVEEQKVMTKVIVSEFKKNQVILNSMLCVGKNQDEIRQKIVKIHMEQKFRLISNAFGQSKHLQVENQNKKSSIAQNKQQKNLCKEQKLIQTQKYGNKKQNNEMQIQITPQNTNSNPQRSKLSQRSLNPSVINKQKTKKYQNFDIQRHSQIVKTNSNQNQQKQIIKIQNDININKSQSYLRLDDVILGDKRISVSDKSQWLKTSISKTEDLQKTQKQFVQEKLQQNIVKKSNDSYINLNQQRNTQTQKGNKANRVNFICTDDKQGQKSNIQLSNTDKPFRKNDQKVYLAVQKLFITSKKSQQVEENQNQNQNCNKNFDQKSKDPLTKNSGLNVKKQNKSTKFIQQDSMYKKGIKSKFKSIATISQQQEISKSSQAQSGSKINQVLSQQQNLINQEWGNELSQISEHLENEPSILLQKQMNFLNIKLQPIIKPIDENIFKPMFGQYYEPITSKISVKIIVLMLLFVIFLVTLQVISKITSLDKVVIKNEDFFYKKPKTKKSKIRSKKRK